MRRLLPWALPAALLLEPVRSTLTYGQINALIMALVAFDCLTRAPRWPRGVLVGVAAALKLLPRSSCCSSFFAATCAARPEPG